MGGYLSWTLQWLLGFKRLGHDVYLVEKSGYDDSCFNPVTRTSSNDCAYGTRTVNDLLARFGLENNWCFVDALGRYHGLTKERVESAFRGADLFVDMGSHGAWLDEAAGCRQRVYVDGEPGFRQMDWQTRLNRGESLPVYDRYYTVGANIGTAASTAPAAGLTWHHVWDPVVVDLYPIEPLEKGAPFNTVMSWQAHDRIVYEGQVYGQKDVEFAKFIDLPRHAAVPLEIAVSGKVPHELLAAAGWRIRDSIDVTISFDSWTRYIASSMGEFSVCKNVFVATNSGFFSDRSAAYLASGRPVVMQDTGFSEYLPCGAGLFPVTDLEDARCAIDAVASDFERHSRAAREIAREHLGGGQGAWTIP